MVDDFTAAIPDEFHEEIRIAHERPAQDMVQLVESSKLLLQHTSGTSDADLKRGLIQNAHCVAVSARHLMEVAKDVRTRLLL